MKTVRKERKIGNNSSRSHHPSQLSKRRTMWARTKSRSSLRQQWRCRTIQWEPRRPYSISQTCSTTTRSRKYTNLISTYTTLDRIARKRSKGIAMRQASRQSTFRGTRRDWSKWIFSITATMTNKVTTKSFWRIILATGSKSSSSWDKAVSVRQSSAWTTKLNRKLQSKSSGIRRSSSTRQASSWRHWNT